MQDFPGFLVGNAEIQDSWQEIQDFTGSQMLVNYLVLSTLQLSRNLQAGSFLPAQILFLAHLITFLV